MTRTKGHDTNTTSSEADTSSSIATTSDEVNEPTQTKESSPSSPPPAKPTKGSENHPKGIDLNFELADLTEEEKEKYERLSNAYGLDPAHSQVTIEANLKQGLHTVAANMSPEQREALGFKLKDLVSSCIMNGDPCDMANDFEQTFDVDYGNCYTFNYHMRHVTRRAGSSFGLRMTILSNVTEYLPSSSEEGVKIVVHNPDVEPFPNTEGYKGPVGQLVSLQVTLGTKMTMSTSQKVPTGPLSASKTSKLGPPHGNCNTLESIAEDKQPFYYNGSYSTEASILSYCINEYNCTDKCMQSYIQNIGDYNFVKNCRCYDACKSTAYKAEVSQSPWPAGGFFYGAYCPFAEKLGIDCAGFYRNNGMTLEVSFSQLGYHLVEEEPTTTAWELTNELAGNCGFWVGYTMLSFVELVLVSIQLCLYCCGCPKEKELPEVPSCHVRNPAESDKDGGRDDSSTANRRQQRGTAVHRGRGTNRRAVKKVFGRQSVISRRRIAPLNIKNSYGEKELTRREVEEQRPSKLERYDPDNAYEPVDPVAAQSTEYADKVADV